MRISTSTIPAVYVLVLSISLLAYFPIIDFHLELEDLMVFESSMTKQEGILYLWTPEWSNYFRPLEWLYYDSIFALFGIDGSKLYLTSIIHHSLNALLLFLFVSYFTGNRLLAVASAVLFASYPTIWEAVSWIVAFGHRLVATGLLVTLIASVHYFKKRTNLSLFMMIFSFILTLGMREQSILILPVIVLIHLYYTYPPINIKNEIKPYLWLLPIFLLYVFYQIELQSSNRLVNKGTFGVELSTISNWLNISVGLFLPNKLIKAMVSPEIINLGKAYWGWLSLIIISVVSFLGWMLLKFEKTRLSMVSFVTARITYFALLFAMINLVIYALFVDGGGSSRYTYLASMGASILIAQLFICFLENMTTPIGKSILGFGFLLLISLSILNVRMGVDTFRDRTDAVENALKAFASILASKDSDTHYHFENPPYVDYAWIPTVSIKFDIPKSYFSAGEFIPEGKLPVVLIFDSKNRRFIEK